MEQRYDRLCEIYYEAAANPNSGYARDDQLLTAIERELPTIFEHYIPVMSAGGERVHPLLQQLAREEGYQDWECPIIEAYHTGQLN